MGPRSVFRAGREVQPPGTCGLPEVPGEKRAWARRPGSGNLDFHRRKASEVLLRPGRDPFPYLAWKRGPLSHSRCPAKTRGEQALLEALAQLNHQEADSFEAEPPRAAVLDLLEKGRRIQANVQARVLPTTWQAFWLHTIEGLSFKEVAQELGIDYDRAYQYHRRVLAMLEQQASQVRTRNRPEKRKESQKQVALSQPLREPSLRSFLAPREPIVEPFSSPSQPPHPKLIEILHALKGSSFGEGSGPPRPIITHLNNCPFCQDALDTHFKEAQNADLEEAAHPSLPGYHIDSQPLGFGSMGTVFAPITTSRVAPSLSSLSLSFPRKIPPVAACS